jgi:hypothetical protein
MRLLLAVLGGNGLEHFRREGAADQGFEHFTACGVSRRTSVSNKFRAARSVSDDLIGFVQIKGLRIEWPAQPLRHLGMAFMFGILENC